MQAKPQKEHHWLEQLVGEWRCESEAIMAPGEPPIKHEGAESVRSVGGVWTLGEGKFVMPDGAEGTTYMTLGYDPEKKAFVGTFIGSMMTFLWVYQGTLDSSGTTLTLDTEGPDFSKGGMTRYQDIIKIESKDVRTLSSQSLGADGKWHHFMTARYFRK